MIHQIRLKRWMMTALVMSGSILAVSAQGGEVQVVSISRYEDRQDLLEIIALAELPNLQVGDVVRFDFNLIANKVIYTLGQIPAQEPNVPRCTDRPLITESMEDITNKKFISEIEVITRFPQDPLGPTIIISIKNSEVYDFLGHVERWTQGPSNLEEDIPTPGDQTDDGFIELLCDGTTGYGEINPFVTNYKASKVEGFFLAEPCIAEPILSMDCSSGSVVATLPANARWVEKVSFEQTNRITEVPPATTCPIGVGETVTIELISGDCIGFTYSFTFNEQVLQELLRKCASCTDSYVTACPR